MGLIDVLTSRFGDGGSDDEGVTAADGNADAGPAASASPDSTDDTADGGGPYDPSLLRREAEQFAAEEGEAFDFSPASLSHLEAYADDLVSPPGGIDPPAGEDDLVVGTPEWQVYRIGGYVGEVLVRSLDAEWDCTDDVRVAVPVDGETEHVSVLNVAAAAIDDGPRLTDFAADLGATVEPEESPEHDQADGTAREPGSDEAVPEESGPDGRDDAPEADDGSDETDPGLDRDATEDDDRGTGAADEQDDEADEEEDGATGESEDGAIEPDVGDGADADDSDAGDGPNAGEVREASADSVDAGDDAGEHDRRDGAADAGGGGATEGVSEFRAAAQRQADRLVEGCSDDLDYSPASLGRLDDLVDEAWETDRFEAAEYGGDSSEDRVYTELIRKLGSYYGEVFVRSLDAEWVREDRTAVAVEGPRDVARVNVYHVAADCLTEPSTFAATYEAARQAVGLDGE